jgi:hypothetical protein
LDQQRAEQAAATAALLPQVVVDPDTGEMTTPPGFKPPDELAAVRIVTQSLGAILHARFRTTAADAVLAALQEAHKH